MFAMEQDYSDQMRQNGPTRHHDVSGLGLRDSSKYPSTWQSSSCSVKVEAREKGFSNEKRKAETFDAQIRINFVDELAKVVCVGCFSVH